jgi:restriction endonuclease S subunit
MHNDVLLLEEIFEIKTGYPLRAGAEYDPNGNLLLVQMKDADALRGVHWSNAITIKSQGRKMPDLLQEDDILFIGRGSRFFAVHVSAPPRNSVASPHFYVLRIKKKGTINIHFVVWLLNSNLAQKFYTTHVEGSGLPYISKKTLAMLPIAVPDRETQESIVITEHCWKRQRRLLEELIEKKERLIEHILEQHIYQEDLV